MNTAWVILLYFIINTYSALCIRSYNSIRYSDMKKQLAEDLEKTVARIRERIIEFSSDTERLERIARMGAEKARESAAKTLNEVRKIIGFRQY